MIRKRKILPALILTVLSILIPVGCSNEKEDRPVSEEVRNVQVGPDRNDIQIDASSAFFPLAEDMMYELLGASDSDKELVTLVATPEGFSNISSGKTDLLISSIPNEAQERMMEESGYEFETIPIREEPLVILVNKDNPLSSIGMDQLLNLYLCDNQNWLDYGGVDLTVASYQLTEGNGSQTAFSQYVKGSRIGEFHQEITSMNQIIDAVADDPGGICYAFNSYVKRMYSNSNTKVIQVDGKSPDDPDYPLICQVSAYYRKNNSNPRLREILDFLQSDFEK